jgi:putative membrane protein
MTEARREPAVLLGAGVLALAISAIRPYSYGTWLLEVLPALIAAPILVLTYRRFPLTPLAYRLILAQALILMIGGHRTYARVVVGTDRARPPAGARHCTGLIRSLRRCS